MVRFLPWDAVLNFKHANHWANRFMNKTSNRLAPTFCAKLQEICLMQSTSSTPFVQSGSDIPSSGVHPKGIPWIYHGTSIDFQSWVSQSAIWIQIDRHFFTNQPGHIWIKSNFATFRCLPIRSIRSFLANNEAFVSGMYHKTATSTWDNVTVYHLTISYASVGRISMDHESWQILWKYMKIPSVTTPHVGSQWSCWVSGRNRTVSPGPAWIGCHPLWTPSESKHTPVPRRPVPLQRSCMRECSGSIREA